MTKIGGHLLRIQGNACFFCHQPVGNSREIDHFIPWSQYGDGGLPNLVAACRLFNNGKRSILAAPEHLEALMIRNRERAPQLIEISKIFSWQCDFGRSGRIAIAAYMDSPGKDLSGLAGRQDRRPCRHPYFNLTWVS
ncbi:MAG: HNH endonuclease [Solirubrobacterales bacterium]|nr:HNH endonuclease [Solirubrobacterales bacterium]